MQHWIQDGTPAASRTQATFSSSQRDNNQVERGHHNSHNARVTWFPSEGSDPCPMQWEHRAFTTGTIGKSHNTTFLNYSLLIGEGNGNPLQCSCLENPRDGWACWAAVYGVAQSWTWLKRLSSSLKITADGDCSHEIKRHILFGRKVMTNLDSILKSRDITLPQRSI